MTEPPLTGDPAAELGLLRRRLARERRARITAEDVGERVTSELYDTVQRLEAAQDELRQHAEVQFLLNRLARDLRRDLDTEGLLRRAVSSVGAATEADRCLIRMAEERSIGPIVEQWSRPGVDGLEAGVALPGGLERLCLSSAFARESLRIDDVIDDPRLSSAESREVVAELGAHAYLGTPMWVGDRLVGWLVVHSTTPHRPWTPRQLAITAGVASDLGTAVMQAEAFQKQAEVVAHLEQVSRVKTELVSTVSHELRTPLTSITGYLELLQDEDLGGLTKSQRRTINVISRNADRLLRLIEDLLSLARVDSGAEADQLEQVDLRQVMSDADRAVSPLASGRDLILRVGTDDHLPTVTGNSRQLEQVVLNLLSNAIKFTPDGGTIAADAVTTSDTMVLTVTDTGHGIAPEDLPHIFDRFYRSADAHERAIQGTGLGLAVVKAIVEAHRGTVQIASTPGRGTAVTVTLPLDAPTPP